MDETQRKIEKAETLLDILVARARGEGDDHEGYLNLRRELLDAPATRDLVPRFVHTCRNLAQFWRYIQPKFPTYKERGAFLQEQFQPLFDHLEGRMAPADPHVSAHLEDLDPDGVLVRWKQAQSRLSRDPEGAITLARTLLESVCKIILGEAGQGVVDKDDLQKLYKKTAKVLRLGPAQHTEQVFKQILTGCASVVDGLAALRNRLGDAHGRGRTGAKPAPRHAGLAVNLAGTMSMFLVETWRARQVEAGDEIGRER